MLLPGCSNEDLSDHASAPVFIPGNSEVEIRFAAHSDEVSTSVDKRATVDEDGNLDEMGVFCLARGKQGCQESKTIEFPSKRSVTTLFFSEKSYAAVRIKALESRLQSLRGFPLRLLKGQKIFCPNLKFRISITHHGA